MGWLRRLRGTLRSSRLDADVEEELRFHLEQRIEDAVEHGATPAEARRAASRRLGNLTLTRERTRDADTFPWLTDLGRDARYALRGFRRNPGFSAMAILTLALGIGATTTIFSFVDAVLLKPLPYPHGSRLVVVSAIPRGESEPSAVTPGDFLEWQARNHVFEDLTAFTFGTFSLTGEGEPEGLLAATVSARFAETLGVAPQIGRSFARVRDVDGNPLAPEHAPFAILSDRLWRNRFQSDPAVLGRAITLDGKSFTVVGVMPPDFRFPDLSSSGGARTLPDIDLWIPITLRPGYRANAFLRVIARLKPDVTVGQARAEMTALARSLGRARGDNQIADSDGGVFVASLHEQIVAGVRPLLLTVFGAVGLLLAIACANVANLLLGRSTLREHEAAIRSALGSGQGRLIRQYLTEGVLLGLAGGAIGMLTAVWGVRLVAALTPPGSLPQLGTIEVDVRVSSFGAAVSVLTGIVFGIVPALHAGGIDVTKSLKTSGRTHTARSRFLRILVVSEVALTFVLLAGAGLLLRSFDRLTSVDPGFAPDRILTLGVTLPDGGYPTLVEMRRFASDVVDRIRRTPGVAKAGAVNMLPIGGFLLRGGFELEGTPRPPGLVAMKPAVSPGYFQAMGIPLRQGRDFNARDQDEAPGVAIVTDGLARRAWPGQSAVGQRLKLGFGRPEDQAWLTVVGVVGDVKQEGLGAASMPAIYVPLAQAPRPFLLRELTFVVRAAGDPRSLAAPVRGQVHGVDRALPIGRTATMAELLSDSVSEPRFRAVLLGGFAGSALALIAVGMLGVLGYFVARRTSEIGVRMALGARNADVIGLVLKQALSMAAAGIAAGAVMSLAATRLLASYLFEISPRDPATFVGAAALVTLLTLAASYIPARRAARVDPLVALRTE